MKGPSGFTLLELLVAIVVAGIVALLVYGTAAAGRETQARLTERRHAMELAQAFHSTLEDALRNARPTGVSGDSAFWMVARRDARGRPSDRLWFVTAGSTAPLTADADWQVSIEPDSDAIVMTCTPVGVARRPVIIRYRGATGLEIHALDFSSPPAWVQAWRFPSFVPAAIELRFWNDSGPIEPPLRVALPLGSSR